MPVSSTVILAIVSASFIKAMQMANFNFFQPVKTISGPNCCLELADALRECGYNKPFVIFDQGVKAAGIVDKVLNGLKDKDMQYVEYGDVIAEPPVTSIDTALEAFLKTDCDSIVAIGGGSSIDTAKAVNMLRFNDGPILKYENPTVPRNPSPGLITIPTTSGTGSEVSNAFVLTNLENHTKHLILVMEGYAEFAVIDPTLTAGTPPVVTMNTGLDAFAHISEGYLTVTGTLATRLVCERFMEDVIEWLPIAVKDGSNLEAREHMCVAATVGGWMLSNAYAMHSIAHAIGGGFGIAHGAACAYTNPYLFEFLAPAVPDRVKKIGEILGAKFKGNETPEEIGAITREVHIKFAESLGLKSIEEYDIDESKFDEMADAIINDPSTIFFAPKLMTKEDAISLLKKVCHK